MAHAKQPAKDRKPLTEAAAAAAVPAPRATARYEDLPPNRPLDGNETVDLANRPGPGETAEDAERPRAYPDSESQNGGRSVEEELAFQANDDDAGGLPHQQLANRGPQASDEGKEIPIPD